MRDRNALAYLVLGIEEEGRIPLEWSVRYSAYRERDVVTAAWDACDDLAALVRLMRLRGALSTATIAELVEVGVPARVFIPERWPTHRPLRDEAVAARVRAIVPAPTLAELLALVRVDS